MPQFCAVRQLCQIIVVSQPIQQPLLLDLTGNVAVAPGNADYRAVSSSICNRGFSPNGRSRPARRRYVFS